MKKHTYEKFIKATANSSISVEIDKEWWEENYRGQNTKVPCKCLKHGEFEMRVASLINSGTCPKCSIEAKKLTFERLKEAIEKYNYPFSLAIDKEWWEKNYRGNRQRVPIHCPVHGLTDAMALKIANGQARCPMCGKESSIKHHIISFEKFKERMRERYGNKYELACDKEWWQKNYKSMHETEIPLRCKIHGVFTKRADLFINMGIGCPQCSNQRKAKRITKEGTKFVQHRTYDDYIPKLREKFGDEYKYPTREWWEKNYKNSKTLIPIVCPKHGEFKRRAYDMLQSPKSPCPKCALEKMETTRKTFEEFAKDFERHHYPFELAIDEKWWRENYRGVSMYIPLKCPKHGVFEAKGHKIINGSVKCQQCRKENNERRKTFKEFQKAVPPKFHQQYYLLVDERWWKENYKNSNTKLPILCPKHGIFEIKALSITNHSYTCPQCIEENLRKKFQMPYSQFLEQCMKYNNHLTLPNEEWWTKNYKNVSTEIPVKCNKHGIEFFAKVTRLISGRVKCTRCMYEELGNTRYMEFEDFLMRANEIHENRYKYKIDKEWWDKNFQTSINTKIPIECPTCGIFEQNVYNHLKGRGCPKCRSRNKRILHEQFMERAHKAHKNTYTYPFDEKWWEKNYQGQRTKIPIICEKHGEFKQTVDIHMRGHRCPSCSHTTSKAERDIREYIESKGFKTEKYRDRSYEIDIFIPELNLGFEYNGILFHASDYPNSKHLPFNLKPKRYHQEKSFYFRERGIQLIHIWEDWWKYNRELVLSFIDNKLGLNQRKIYARKCMIARISKQWEEAFLEKNHFQGYHRSTVCYGLFHEGNLVQMMSFVKIKGQWKLERFATKQGLTVVGGASKLFKRFVEEFKPNEILSYSNIDINNLPERSIYRQLGMRFDGYTEPSYFYFDEEYHRYSREMFQKHKLVKKYSGIIPDIEQLTEKEITRLLGYIRVHNSGNFRWRWLALSS